MIQRSDPEREYNVPGKKGVVYNFLEDCCEPVTEGGFIVTGILGEMWPINGRSLAKYGVHRTDVGFAPVEVRTVELDTVYAGIQVPADTPFTLETDYGERAVLHGNRPGISHGEGDYIIVFARKEKGTWVPDLSCGERIINGAVFSELYREYE